MFLFRGRRFCRQPFDDDEENRDQEDAGQHRQDGPRPQRTASPNRPDRTSGGTGVACRTGHGSPQVSWPGDTPPPPASITRPRPGRSGSPGSRCRSPGRRCCAPCAPRAHVLHVLHVPTRSTLPMTAPRTSTPAAGTGTSPRSTTPDPENAGGAAPQIPPPRRENGRTSRTGTRQAAGGRRYRQG